ncbi:MAG: hypothetical protein PHN44_10920 [Candidatus Marinimicrobia bacterium]|nr:hypothetical protein [Candidatus Neomarinimicrobiota bacterium]
MGMARDILRGKIDSSGLLKFVRREDLGGIFIVSCRDKDGNLVWTERQHNLVTNEGLNHLLNVELHATAAITTWYCVIFESDTTILATHTYASPGYTECTSYDEATRPEYVEAAASGQSITNAASKATYTISATKTIYGAALVGGGTAANTKGDAAGGGTLLCAAKFSSSYAVQDNYVLTVTYPASAVDDGV